MIAYTGGSFDGLHIGHLELLASCRRMGTVVVSLNTDAFIERYKGRPPQFGYEERAEMLRALRDVDLVVCNVGDEDSRVAIDVVRPDVIVIGADWLDPGHDERRYHAQLGVDDAWLAARDLTVAYIPRTRGRSSSALRHLKESA